MEAHSAQHHAIGLSNHPYSQVANTFADLPPPIDDRPKALLTRNHAAMRERIAQNVPENKTNSHDAAFETESSEQPYNRISSRSGKPDSRLTCVGHASDHNVSENRTNSHDAPFETKLSKQPDNRISTRSGKADPRSACMDQRIDQNVS